MVRVALFALAALNSAGAWKPEACSELAEGVPCRELYEHPQGSTFVSTCPKETWTVADGCAAYLDGKSEAEQCPQITCPVAMAAPCAGHQITLWRWIVTLQEQVSSLSIPT